MTSIACHHPLDGPTQRYVDFLPEGSPPQSLADRELIAILVDTPDALTTDQLAMGDHPHQSAPLFVIRTDRVRLTGGVRAWLCWRGCDEGGEGPAVLLLLL